jgi:HEPN domain-containing protein
VPLTRTDLQQLADVRITEADALLAAGLWDGAYYLAGYAVECALKACIMAHVERTGVIFEDKKFSEKCWTHKIEDLVGLAGLKADRDADSAADPALELNWATVAQWDEARRYKRTPEADARRLCEAISGSTNGVLLWIKKRW